MQEINKDVSDLHKTVSVKSRKQPPTAFSLFCQAKRPRLCEKHPGLKYIDVHKQLFEKWKELDEDAEGT